MRNKVVFPAITFFGKLGDLRGSTIPNLRLNTNLY